MVGTISLLAGVALSFVVLRADRRSAAKHHHRWLHETRTALAQEAMLLGTLEPGTEAARRLQGVIDSRTNAYLGISIAKPKLARSCIFAVLCAIAAVPMGISLSHSASVADEVVFGLSLGVTATFSLVTALSVLRLLSKHRSSVASSGHAAQAPDSQPFRG